MEQFGILHIDFPIFDTSKFQSAVSDLQSTQYHLSAIDSDAPTVTHCISAVRYIVEHATGYRFPPMYIGDMCRNILDNRILSSRIIPLDQGECGDLIFFRGKTRSKNSYMITHVGILLDNESFFHSAYGRGGTVDMIGDVLQRGTIASCDILSRLTDPRSVR